MLLPIIKYFYTPPRFLLLYAVSDETGVPLLSIEKRHTFLLLTRMHVLENKRL